MTTSFERSAIIGYFRCGATLKQIAIIMHLKVVEVYEVIDSYFEE